MQQQMENIYGEHCYFCQGLRDKASTNGKNAGQLGMTHAVKHQTSHRPFLEKVNELFM